MIFYANHITLPKTQVANPGETSLYNNYINTTGLKHDFFKLFFMTFIPGLLSREHINIFSVRRFNKSLFGRSLIVALTIAFFHTSLQPLINYMPIF
jgi:hypothetical protein